MTQETTNPAPFPTGPSRSTASPDRATGLILWAAPAVFLYIVIGGLTSQSRNPWVLGRYSYLLAGFNCWNALLILGFLIAYLKRARAGLILAYLVIAATTLIAPFNGELNHAPGMTVVLPLIRLLACFGMIVAEFDRHRRTRSRPSPLILSLAGLLFTVTLLDFALMGYVALFVDKTRPGNVNRDYRDDYDLNAIAPEDVLLAGDSFVWGYGVEKNERFGDVLQRNMDSAGWKSKVYSFGIIGSETSGYIQSLEKIPAGKRVRRIVMSFYMNDMICQPMIQDHFVGMCRRMRRSSMTLWLLTDKVAQLFLPNVDVAHAYIVDTYDPADPSFNRRWTQLEGELTRFRALSAQLGDPRPLFLILPLMVDYHQYPLDAAHPKLAEAASRIGYGVLDMLPLFRSEMGDGTKYRTRPDDNHFDARAHQMVGAALWERLRTEGNSNGQ